jgi:NAD(P)-dependent dehydrogenase (short-subunit alcohol dehydrogenase family)
VRRLAEEITAKHDRLELLINNAGIGSTTRGKVERETSRDGHELRFAVNYLAPFLLTHLLLPLIRKSAPARIVNVASAGQQRIDFSDVMLTRGYDGMRAYCQSKLALVMFTFDIAETLKGSGVTVNCLHPATLMNTKMVIGSGFSITAWTTLKTAVQAPIPSMSVRTATAVKPGFLIIIRRP